MCIALLDYVWHGDHRTLIVAQGQVRACTSVYLCVCVCGFVGLCLAWRPPYPHCGTRSGACVYKCVCVYLCVGVCVCVALLGYVLHGDHRTLIVAHDQVCACTSVYLCVCMCVRGFVGLCLAWRPLYPLLWHKIRCVRVRV